MDSFGTTSSWYNFLWRQKYKASICDVTYHITAVFYTSMRHCCLERRRTAIKAGLLNSRGPQFTKCSGYWTPRLTLLLFLLSSSRQIPFNIYHNNVLPNPYLSVSHDDFAAFTTGPVFVGFVVDKVAVGQVLPPVLQFSPVSVIPQCSICIPHLQSALYKLRHPQRS